MSHADLLHLEFEATARRLPNKTALVCAGQRLSYADLERRSAVLAVELQRAGLVQGDRVGLYLDNTPEMVVGLLAVLRAGGVCMTINPLTRLDKLKAILGSTRAAALLTQPSLAAVWRDARRDLPALRTVVVAGATSADVVGDERAWPAADASPQGELAACAAATDDLAFISHTSGTTGAPKGVMLSHANLLAATRAARSYLGLTEDDIVGCALPLSFNYGLTHVWMCFALGATLVLERGFSFPAKVVEALSRERVTVFPGVPTIYAMLTNLGHIAQVDLSSLRLLTNAAAALPLATVQRIRTLWPQAQLFSMYGQTECTRISFLPPEEVERRPASVGRGMPGQDHWLEDEQGQRVAPGGSGELVVRGAHVMLGYWERPEESAAKVRDGAAPGQRILRTGDLFHMDQDGWLFFVARGDDIIKTRGEKVSPREVEDAICHLDGVLECAVVGMPDELLGQSIHAFVVLKDGVRLSDRDVIKHCSRTLESFMAPKQVTFLSELPKTDNGKTRKRDLPGIVGP